MTLTELVNKTLAPGNEIEKAVGRGAVQEAVQRINAISDVLNEQNATNDNMVEQNKRVRSEKQMSHLGEAVLRDTVIEFGLKHYPFMQPEKFQFFSTRPRSPFFSSFLTPPHF